MQMQLIKQWCWFTIQVRKNQCIFWMVQIRTAGSQAVTLPGTYAGDTVELFMAFVSADGTQVSNSVYLGSGTAA